jgi:hypothetical protein
MRFVLLGLVLIACTDTQLPTPTQTVCPSPETSLTWDNFGQKFMADYCTACHDSSLTRAAQRNGAPQYHDYDTLVGVLEIPDHIDQYAGSGPAAHNTQMPPGRCPSVKGGSLNIDCPKPTDEERTNLSLWLACEVGRPH